MGEVIAAEHVSMNFRMNMNHTTSMKEWVISRLKGQLKYQDFYALNDVSFRVNQGEVVGIVGTNGSGKSTLLKCISGIYKPTGGKVATAGRIVPCWNWAVGLTMSCPGRRIFFSTGPSWDMTRRF